ncbi:MAG: EpsG family protein [Oscillospiraceae bacterium]
MALLAFLVLIGYIICNKTNLKHRKGIYLGIVFLILASLSAIRYEVGFDYSFTYVPGWRQVLDTPFSEFNKLYHEKGYVLLEYLISLVTENFQAIFISTSIILVALPIILICKYAADKIWGVFLYYSIGLYYCSMNFIRQSIAAFIFAFAVVFAKKKKIIPYMLLVILASTFHKSALLMIPFYFILQIRITKLVLVLYSAVTIGILFTSNIIVDFVIQHFYQGYKNESIYIIYGVKWYYIVVPVILFVIMFVFQDRLCKDDKSNQIYVSCSFFNMFFYLVALNHVIVDRFTLYFEPTLVIGLTYLITQLRSDRNQENLIEKFKARFNKRYIIITSVIVVCVLTTNIISLIDDGHAVIPYQTIFESDDYRQYYYSINKDNEIITEQPEEVDLSDILI